MNDEEVENFKQKYRARIREGHMRYAVPMKISVLQTMDPLEPIDFEYESSVQIDLPKREFEQLIGMEAYFDKQLRDRDWENFSGYAKSIVKQHEREVRIRNSNPAAKRAYEKYQTIMRMVDSYYKE